MGMVLMLIGGVHWVLVMSLDFSKGQHILFKHYMVLWGLVAHVQSISFHIFGLFIQGTPLMRVYLRILGAKIGKGVFWDTFPPIETCALDIGDNVVIEDM